MQGPLRRPTGSLHLYVRVFRAFRGYLSVFGATRRRSRVRCVARTRRFHRQLSPATDDIDLHLPNLMWQNPPEPQRSTKDTKENECLLCVSPALGCPHTILWPTNSASPLSPSRQIPNRQRSRGCRAAHKSFPLCPSCSFVVDNKHTDYQVVTSSSVGASLSGMGSWRSFLSGLSTRTSSSSWMVIRVLRRGR
jgi:hypothetical protein